MSFREISTREGALTDLNGNRLDFTRCNEAGTASYIIYVDALDSNKVKAKITTTGQVVYSNSDAITVINAAISALGGTGSDITGGGRVHLTPALYLTTATLQMKKFTALEGQGPKSTVVQPQSDFDAITMDAVSSDGSGWAIRNLGIDMNNKNGNGIQSTAACSQDNSEHALENLYVKNVSAGYWGMNLARPMQVQGRGIKITSNGGGILLDNTAQSIHYGNSQFDGIDINLTGQKSTALYVLGYPNNYIDFIGFGKLDIMSIGTYHNNTGVEIDYGQHISFDHLLLESFDTCSFKTIKGIGIHVKSGYMHSSGAATDGILLTGATGECDFEKIEFNSGRGYAFRNRSTISSVGRNPGTQAVKLRDCLFQTSPADGIDLGFNTIASDNMGLNRMIQVTNPFYDTQVAYDGTNNYSIRLTGGVNAAPASGRRYLATHTSYLISVTGGKVSSIVISDRDGNQIASLGTSCLGYFLRRGYAITVTYSSAPTVSVWDA
jgi:hypothetical protein